MAKTGRRSSAELSTYPRYRPPVERLQSPPGLSEPARKVFVDIVTTTRAHHFEPSDLPLLCRYCEATALAQRAEAALASAGAVVDGTVSPWVGVLTAQTKVLQGLSMRLRLSPQARQPNNPTRPQSASFYDRVTLERAANGVRPPDDWGDK